MERSLAPSVYSGIFAGDYAEVSIYSPGAHYVIKQLFCAGSCYLQHSHTLDVETDIVVAHVGHIVMIVPNLPDG